MTASFAITVQRDIPYVGGGDAYRVRRCRLDLHVPAGAEAPPVLVWFHGGGMTEGDKAAEETRAVATALAARGIAVAAANYRLSPAAPYPHYLRDAATAVWPILTYRDAKAAIAFLRDAFGFVERAAYAREGDPSVIEHAEMRWPLGGGVMFGTAGKDDGPFGSRATGNDSVYVVCDDPDGLFERATAAGATVVRGLADEGRAVVIASHLFDEVTRTGDDVIVLERGRKVADAPLAEFVDGYDDLESAYLDLIRPAEHPGVIR